MTWPLTPDLPVGAVEIEQPVLATRAEATTGDTANEWLCAWCLNRVASEKDRQVWDGRTEFAFANPAGIRFHIVTFARTLGCREAGVPTLENTWFAGYAWSFCLCDRCGTHLGWFYTGSSRFAGLIRDRIVRATSVRN